MNTELLKKYLEIWGRILPRKLSQLCLSHQKEIAKNIKLARELGLLK